MLHRVLVPVDVGQQAHTLVTRVAALPLAVNAELELLHVIPAGLSLTMRATVLREVRGTLAGLHRQLQELLPPSVTVRGAVGTGVVVEVIVGRAHRWRPDLIVLARSGRHAWRDRLVGSTAERVVRMARRPTLLVRRPVIGRYARPLIALEDDEAAVRALTLGLSVAPSRSPVPILHVFALPYGGRFYHGIAEAERDLEIERQRRRVARRIRRRLAIVGDGDGMAVAGQRWRLQLRQGDPRQVVPAQVKRRRHDLLVLGTHGRTGMSQAFIGSIAGDIARSVECDVLLVPPRHG